MFDSIADNIFREPIATIGFALTWVAAAIAALFQHLRIRADRRERIADVLADASRLANQTMFRYTHLRGDVDREIAKLGTKGIKPPDALIEVRDEFSERRDSLSNLEDRIRDVDSSDGTHKNLLLAISLRNEAQSTLATSEELIELRSAFPTPTDDQVDDRSLVPMTEAASECVAQLNESLGGLLKLKLEILSSLIGIPGTEAPAREVDPKVARVVVPLIQSAGSSVAAMQNYSAPGLRTRECYLMARAIVETLVNACFVIAEGRKAAARAEQHARQKAIRDLNRQSEIAGHKIVIGLAEVSAVENNDRLSEDLAEFTTKSGKEDRRWTKETVDERIKIAGEKYGRSVLSRLHYARFAVYRHSSEILHGTLFGYLYFHGETGPKQSGSNQQHFAAQIVDQHTYLLLSVICAISAFIKCFHKEYGMNDVDSSAERLVKKVLGLQYLQPRKDKGTKDE